MSEFVGYQEAEKRWGSRDPEKIYLMLNEAERRKPHGFIVVVEDVGAAQGGRKEDGKEGLIILELC